MHNAGSNNCGFNWEHIFDRHAPWGNVAKQSGKKDIFEGLTEEQIRARVKAAWKERELIGSNYDIDGLARQQFRGVDEKSGQIIEFWYNPRTKIVETAYPQGFVPK